MLSTYRAIINGDKIIWIDKPPTQLDGVEVHITLLKEVTQRSQQERNEVIAQSLARLAQLNLFRDVEDPVKWQRDIRGD